MSRRRGVHVGDRAIDTESVDDDAVLVLRVREGLEGRIAEAVFVDDLREALDGWRCVGDVRDAVELGALDSYFFPGARLRELDPHEVVPRRFWDRFDRLREAQADVFRGGLSRCPECGATGLQKKRDDMRPQPHRKNGIWKCRSCHWHGDEPAPSAIEVAPDPRELDTPTIEQLREVREALELTQRQVAERADISFYVVSRLERGREVKDAERVRDAYHAVLCEEWEAIDEDVERDGLRPRMEVST